MAESKTPADTVTVAARGHRESDCDYASAEILVELVSEASHLIYDHITLANGLFIRRIKVIRRRMSELPE